MPRSRRGMAPAPMVGMGPGPGLHAELERTAQSGAGQSVGPPVLHHRRPRPTPLVHPVGWQARRAAGRPRSAEVTMAPHRPLR